MRVRLLRHSTRGIALCAGLFVAPSPATAEALAFALKNLVCFCLLFFAASTLLNLVLRRRDPHWLKKKKGKKIGPASRPGFRYYAQLFTSCFVILASLQILRLNTAPLVFYAILGLLICKSIEKRARYRQNSLLRLTAAFTFDVGAGLISYQLLFPSAPQSIDAGTAAAVYLFGLQRALLFSAGLAFMTLAVMVAKQLETIYRIHAEENAKLNRRRKPAPPPTQRWRRLHAALILLGPSMIGIGIARGLFPAQCQLVLLCILAAVPMLQRQHKIERSALLPEGFVRQSAGLCLLFAAIILFAGR